MKKLEINTLTYRAIAKHIKNNWFYFYPLNRKYPEEYIINALNNAGVEWRYFVDLNNLYIAVKEDDYLQFLYDMSSYLEV